MADARWRAEPFRVFFPLGVVLAWIGIGHWLLYALGVTATYSCQLHGLVQMQGFMVAFAFGFLWTAVPRRTGTSAATGAEVAAAVAGLVLTVAGAVAERWLLAEAAYGALLVLLLAFALRRFVTARARRRPPAAFVLIPLGVLHGLAGAALIAIATTPRGPARFMALGRLLVEQGVFLSFVLGVGALVVPLIGGAPPPPDLDASPAERRKAVAFAAGGLALFASLVAEHAGLERAAPLARAAIVVAVLVAGAGAHRAPGKPGLHRRLVWLALWLVPVGLAASGIWPAYRVPALHVLFIGGFSLLAFAIATHVALSHLGFETLALGRPPVVVALGVTFVLAMLARVAADASHSYFAHLGWAAGTWLVGSALWLAFFAPRFFPSRETCPGSKSDAGSGKP
jgi:uncharacterized protein involved in response to NO